jgi:hypothetical protein
VKSRSPKDRARGLARGQFVHLREPRSRLRALRLEALEPRAMLTGATYTYPYGAMPDDTGEYMLGDVVVNVVFMQSDPNMAPYDVAPKPTGNGYTAENWTPDEITSEEAKISAAMQWWKDTLATEFPKVPSSVLNFHLNFKYADTPVLTGYEPIARSSNDFSPSTGTGWIYDFLHFVHYDQTGQYSTDIKAFNDSTRIAANADWATTIFVVNNVNDFDPLVQGIVVAPATTTQFTSVAANGSNPWSSVDGFYDGEYARFTTGALTGQKALITNYVAATKTFTLDTGSLSVAPGVGDKFDVGDGNFAPGGFDKAFSFSGGRFEVVPASRPIKTFAHETGHQFWALDEYSTANVPYNATRGYYNTPDANSVVGQSPGFVQADSIMSNGAQMENSYENHSVDPYALAAIGWQDSDDNGIFDVLDVPFSLSGYGDYNGATHQYEFRGSTHVNTLPNRNSYYSSNGTQDDIQIDQINVVEESLDDGLSWQAVAIYSARTYSTNVSINIPISAGMADIWLRSRDTRTGVTSNVFKGEVDLPTQDDGVGVGGVVFLDQNANGALDTGEKLEPDINVEVTNDTGASINLQHLVEPDDYDPGTIITTVPEEEPDVTLSVLGGGGAGKVIAMASTIAPQAANVFGSTGTSAQPLQTWSSTVRFRADFSSQNVGTVSLNAYGGNPGSASFARLEAFNAAGKMVARYSTAGLTPGSSTTMTVSRPQGDIAYVVGYARPTGSVVVLDSLTWGAGTSSTSNSVGAYSLDNLPDGTYQVHVSAAAGYTITTPASGYATITVADGRTSGSVNFGIAPPSTPTYRFHNYANPFLVKYDANHPVNRDPAPIDLVTVISYINGHFGESEFSPGIDPNAIGYVDVIADNIIAPNDIVALISYLNGHNGGGESSPASMPPALPPASGGSGSGEGENILQVQVPQTAADYFAQNTTPFLNIVDTDDDAGRPTAASLVNAGSAIASDQKHLASSFSSLGPQAFAASSSSTDSSVLSALDEAISQIQSLRSTLPQRLASSFDALPASLPTSVHQKLTGTLNRLTTKLEKTLDDIATDIADTQTKLEDRLSNRA